mmetsp:Transcript_139345/g.242284  ORF Transcript_139345/g.242284 Transcript_139345/m.242284 type:complete len:139 (+) Transcript_139345:843-1259(+)
MQDSCILQPPPPTPTGATLWGVGEGWGLFRRTALVLNPPLPFCGAEHTVVGVDAKKIHGEGGGDDFASKFRILFPACKILWHLLLMVWTCSTLNPLNECGKCRRIDETKTYGVNPSELPTPFRNYTTTTANTALTPNT